MISLEHTAERVADAERALRSLRKARRGSLTTDGCDDAVISCLRFAKSNDVLALLENNMVDAVNDLRDELAGLLRSTKKEKAGTQP